MSIFELSHSVENIKKGFFSIHPVAKYQTKGDSLETLNTFREKSLRWPEELERGTIWCRPVLHVTF